MSEWNAFYPNNYGEYEIVFKSQVREKVKAVEKVCCAIMDGLVSSPRNVVIEEIPEYTETETTNKTSVLYIRDGVPCDMNKAFCNICGKEFDIWDQQEGFGFHYHVGYGSKFDGDRIHVDLCCDCFDELMDTYILPRCKVSPLEDGDAV